MKFGIVVFPGSNCDHDCYHVADSEMDETAEYLWHKETDLKDSDCVIIPGGFSYGDYLRSGAIARFSPIMETVIEFARSGGSVLGICNGFQVLLECGLLPGAMRRNENLKFICDTVNVRLDSTDTPFTSEGQEHSVYRIPIAHFDGNYYADDETLDSLDKNDQIVFRYSSEDGDLDENPNGSRRNIAGICNKDRNVLGMMPHPERCSEAILGNRDGRFIFESIINNGR